MDVAAWLQGLGLERHAPAFLENRIEADILPSLTLEDLRDLGVTLVGDRRRLLDAIAALGVAISTPAASAPAVTAAAPAPPASSSCSRLGNGSLHPDSGSTSSGYMASLRLQPVPGRRPNRYLLHLTKSAPLPKKQHSAYGPNMT
jgi:hypothetical protein